MMRAVIRIAVALASLTAAVAMAQQSTTTETKEFEIIAVDGNRLDVRLPEGTKELVVPDDFRFNVDGRMLTVSELKPGMSGTATITTRTTVIPVTVTEVKNGTVLKQTGSSIYVRTDQGIRVFTQDDVTKRNVKIMREGKPATIADFRENDQLTATIITSKPPRIVTEKEVQAALEPAPAAKPAATAGHTPVGSQPTASTTGTTMQGTGPGRLPKTASPLPLLGLVGLGSLAAALGLRRRRTTR